MRKLLIMLLCILVCAGSVNAFCYDTPIGEVQVANITVMKDSNVHPNAMSILNRNPLDTERVVKVIIDTRLYMTASADGHPCLIKIENFSEENPYMINPQVLGEYIVHTYRRHLEEGQRQCSFYPNDSVRVTIKFMDIPINFK